MFKRWWQYLREIFPTASERQLENDLISAGWENLFRVATGNYWNPEPDVDWAWECAKFEDLVRQRIKSETAQH